MGRTATARRGDPRTKLYSQVEELDKRIEDEGHGFSSSLRGLIGWMSTARRRPARRSRLRRSMPTRCSPNVQWSRRCPSIRRGRCAAPYRPVAVGDDHAMWASCPPSDIRGDGLSRTNILEIAHEWRVRPSEVMREWKPSDVELAAAWMEYKRSHHGPCGRIDRALIRVRIRMTCGGGGTSTSLMSLVCHACAAESEKREQIEQSGKTNRGVFVTSHREPLGSAKAK